MQALKIGDSASTSKLITKQDVQDFASLTLDTNPLHVDEVYAQGTRFKQPIVHGMFSLRYLKFCDFDLYHHHESILPYRL